MSSQTVNTYSVDTGLLVGNNITTGTVTIGNTQTSGDLDIGTGSSRTGDIRIGNTANTGDIHTRTTGQTEITTGTLDITSTGTCTITAPSFIFGPKGTVTQITSQNTAVTINTPLGKITTVTLNIQNNHTETFQVNNSIVTESSIVMATVDGYDGDSILSVTVNNISNGSFQLNLENGGGGTLNDLCTIAYMIL